MSLKTLILAPARPIRHTVDILLKSQKLLHSYLTMPEETHSSPLTARLYQTLKRHPKRIVFADGEDIRVIRVAVRMVQMEIAAPILIGNRERIHKLAKENSLPMTFINVIDPSTTSDIELFCDRLTKVSRYRGKEISKPLEIVSRPHNFAAMMIQYGHADGMIAGNKSLPTSVFRAATTMIKPLPKVATVFGAVILTAPNINNFGRDGILFMADCGVIPDPDVKQLASIAVETGKLAHHFLGRRPRVAMLSHSTHGSSETASAKKVIAATQLARQRIREELLNIDIDGEIQADVALDNSTAEIKVLDARAKDPADVLVYPNLDAGHISLKLLEQLAGAQGHGQLIMGLTRPAAQVSRSISEEGLLGTAAIVGAEAIKTNDLRLEKQRAKK